MRRIFKKIEDFLILIGIQSGIQSEIKIQELDPSEPDLPAESFGEFEDFEAPISDDLITDEGCECGGNCGCGAIDIMPEPSIQEAVITVKNDRKKAAPKKGAKKESNDAPENIKKKKTTKRRYYKRKDSKKKD